MISVAGVSKSGSAEALFRAPMGLEIGFAPDAMHQVPADPEFGRQRTAGPLGRPVTWPAAGGVENARPQARRQGRRRPARLPHLQAFDAVLYETVLPFGDGRCRHIELGHDRPIREPITQQQDHCGPSDQPCGERGGIRNLLQVSPLSSRQLNTSTGKRHAEKTTLAY